MDDSPSVILRRLVNGYQVSQAIHVAATLGVADRLADGPRTSDELAAAVGAHPPTLYRLLRALAAVGVLHEEDGRRFALTPVGECLRSDADEPVGGWAAIDRTAVRLAGVGRAPAQRPHRRERLRARARRRPVDLPDRAIPTRARSSTGRWPT